MSSESVKQQVLESTNIVELISGYVTLKRKGRDYECNCPFHEENTASFKVSESKKMFKCFGCGKSGNAIDFVMEYKGLPYLDALREVASRAGISLDDNAVIREPKAIINKATPQDTFTYEKKDFTQSELRLLGRNVTAAHCADFNLFSVKSYTSAKNEKGESWKVESSDDYPIFIYDYDSWGKIYQPLSKDYRFTYFGAKPDNYIASDKKTAALIANAKAKVLPEEENKLTDLIIVSGGSDALNTYAAGYHVCFLNSETAELSDFDFKNILQQIAKKIYVLYDIDATGVKSANRLALRFLDRLNVIRLPEDLSKYRDRKGKPCKDVKDFFNFYRHKNQNLTHLFRQIVGSSIQLCFWSEKYDKQGGFSGYDINNEQLYAFLNANGLYTMPNEQSRRGYTFVHINQNVVTEIKDDELPSYAGRLLVSFLKENLQYYSLQLINTIHRSNQVKLASLEKVSPIELDFKSFTDSEDFLFFQNTAVRITAQGVETSKVENLGKYVYSSKIIDFHFNKQPAPFVVEYSKEYLEAKRLFESVDQSDPDYLAKRRAFEKFNPLNRFELTINDKDFCLSKFIYNTGRTFWRKEELGLELTAEEKKEHDLHFINKVAALGYLLYRFKEKSRGYMVYGMETEMSEIGAHLGGTGKSMFFELLDWCRTVFFRDGQRMKRDEDDSYFAGVRKGVTDIIYFDDLQKNVDLHVFMPMATSKMTVRNLYENTVVIDYEDSPKVAFTSNHPIDKFDASLRRRTWFVGFSDYYHAEDLRSGVVERSARTEFGINLPHDLSTEDMNRFYNFMAYCLHTYMKFKIRINPPMDNIEKRNIQRAITDEFIWWADDYFTPERLNTAINKQDIFEAWRSTLSDSAQKVVRLKTLREKLILYCDFKGYEFCPDDVLSTPSERERREIRKSEGNKDVYCYHIRAMVAADHKDDGDETLPSGSEDELAY